MTPSSPIPRALGVLLSALALASCSGSDDEKRGEPAAKVETTRVEVIKESGKASGFDPSALYERLSPGVVTVFSQFGGGAGLLEDGGEGGQGSGFVVDGDGYIATNAHVVTTGKARSSKRAKSVWVQFPDGNRVPAKIVGDDPNADVALLKFDPKGLSIRPLELAAGKDTEVGEPVIAIGSPFGEDQSLSVGVVSALDRTIESLTDFRIGSAVQTDAAINPGNSGGPLLDAKGRVVGINAQIKSQSGGGEGVGFAIGADVVRRSLRDLREEGRVDYGYLGVKSLTLWPQAAKKLGVDASAAAAVDEVTPDSPARRAGLESGRKRPFQGVQLPTDGDVIVAVNGRRLSQRNDLADEISKHGPGDEVELDVVRGDDRRTVKVKLGRRPLELE